MAFVKWKNAISMLLVFLLTVTVLSSCDTSDLEKSTDSEPIGKSVLAESTTAVQKTATTATAMPTATTTEKAIETTKAPIETKTPATTAKAATAAKKAPVTTKKAPVTTKKATPKNDIVITSDMTFRRNEMATVSIKAAPDTEYSIRVYYNSGASKAAGLENKKSDANGNVSWTWKIGGKTAPGTYKIVISGAGNSITKQFTVIES